MPGRKRDGGTKSDPGVHWRVADGRNVSYDGEGLFTYSGKGEESEESIGTVWTTQPLDPRGGTFEVKIVDTGERNCIAIGLCHRGYPADALPGWKETSIAFHADEGSLFHSSDDPLPLGLPCKAGDTIRCSLLAPSASDLSPLSPSTFTATTSVRFYRNGSRVAQVVVGVPDGGFYGVVGMMSPGERVLVQPPALVQPVDFERLWVVRTPTRVAHEGGGRCGYVGPEDATQQSVGTLQKRWRIDPTSSASIFGDVNSSNNVEVAIARAGSRTCIAVGVCSETYPAHLLPGWDKPSLGYHADNGMVFKDGDEGTPTGQSCQTGDMIRCTVEPMERSAKEVRVTFQRNNVLLASTSMGIPEEGLYFCVGMMNPDEKVCIILPEVLLPPPTPTTPTLQRTFASDWDVVAPLVEHRGNGLCAYIGPGGFDHIGTLRSRQPLDPLDGARSAFEVKIVSGGRYCHIAVGVCNSTYPTSKMPGWAESSVGYHADDGCIHQGTITKQGTGQLCQVGDVIRCSLEPQDGSQKEVAVTFHRNGLPVFQVIQWSPSGGHYALVGMMNEGEAVQVSTTSGKLMWGQQHRGLEEGGVGHPEATPSHGYRDPLSLSLSSASEWTMAGRGGGVRGTGVVPFPLAGRGGRGGMGAGGVPLPPPPLAFHHSHSFSGTLPTDLRPPLFPPRGPEYFHEGSTPFHPQHQYYTQEHRFAPEHSPYHPHPREHLLYHHPEHAPSNCTDNPPPYETQEHSSYYTSEHPPHPSHYQPAHHLQQDSPHLLRRHPGFYPTGLPSPYYNSIQSPLLNRNPAYRRGQYYGLLPAYPQDPHGQVYQQQSSVPEPSHVVLGLEKNNPDTKRSKSTPPQSTEMLPETFQAPAPMAKVDTARLDPMVDDCAVSTKMEEILDAFDHSGKEANLETETGYPTDKKGGLPEEEKTYHMKERSTSTKDNSTPYTDTQGNESTPRTSTQAISSAFHDTPMLKRLLSSTSNLPDIPPLPKTANKTFQFLYNVTVLDTGSLQCSPSVPGDIGFIMSRQPLSEKMQYYEVEIVRMAEGGAIQVGLVWNGFPVRKLPGTLQGSLGYNSCTGSLHTGPVSTRQVSLPCMTGDIVGCRARLCYKQEVVHKGEGANDVEMVKVELFRNGCLVGDESVSLPPSGLFPAVALMGEGTQVVLCRSLILSPENYFSLHPLPAGFVNFTPPPSLDLSWNCMQNARVTGEGLVFQVVPGAKSFTIIQCSLPFSFSHSFCEVQLQIPLSKLSTVSVGVLPKVTPSIRITDMIPGESQSSIGFFPLLGFLMKNGVITSTIPESIISEIKASGSLLNIGFGINFHNGSSPSPATTGASTQTAEVFFTLSQQQLSSIVVALPPSGLYPTIVFDTDIAADTKPLAKIEFPVLWPQVSNLPYGFVRGNDGINVRWTSVLQVTEYNAVHVVQAGFPLSLYHSYYEVMIRCINGDTPQLAVGLASYRHPLNILPGMGKDSIALHVHDGAVYETGVGRETVAPGCCSVRQKVGCGARFSTDGSTRYAEVFFTINGKIVSRRLVQIPLLGLFPTIGLHGFVGGLDLNPFVPDPFPELVFTTTWKTLKNIQFSGHQISSIVPTKLALAQLSSPASLSATTYFTVSLPQPINRSAGKVFIGFSNSAEPPFGNKQQLALRSCFLDVVSGTIVWCEPQVHSDDIGSTASGRVIGCGIQPLSDHTPLLFFTMDNQVIFSAPFIGVSGSIFPTLCLIDCHTKVTVDTCACWPPKSRIGKGWSRSSNLKVVNSKICHIQCQPTSSKAPVGFAQASFPFTPAQPYFEVEITSQDPKKAIAVGLASRECLVNSWVGTQDNSVAYYSDSGKLYMNNSGKDFGPKLIKGDTVGCGMCFPPNNLGSNRNSKTTEVFFTVNGTIIGQKKVTVPHGGFFPTVCLDSTTSIVPFFHSKFPPTQGFVSEDWALAYGIAQVGQLLYHRGTNISTLGGIPWAFCQAATELTSKRPYFEVEVVSSSSGSTISMGVGVKQGAQATYLEQDFLMYSSNGEVLTKRGGHKSTQTTQRYCSGDLIGCSVIRGTQNLVEFNWNGTKVITVLLPEGPLQSQPLFPLILLSHPGDVVLPRLSQPLPVFNSFTPLGWLRTERVTIKNLCTVEFTSSPQAGTCDAGMAQISQPLGCPGIAYFELEVLDTGTTCTVGIGVASPTCSLAHPPGWDKDSFGWHGSDGCIYLASSSRESFGPSWKKHDIIGLGIRSPSGKFEPGSEVQVYFAQNGQELGHCTVDVPATKLFPVISLQGREDRVKVSISTSGQCSNSDLGRLAWRALCGVTLRKDRSSGLVRLEYCSRHHKAASCGYRLGVAISHQPLSGSMQYFEVQLCAFGKMKAIAVGVVPRNYSLEMLCGWGSGSVAYHTDSGELFNQSGIGKVFGPIPKVHSTVGCGISFVPNSNRHCFVFFTYNGSEIGRVRTTIPEGGLYPSVTLTSAGDKVAVLFEETFKPKFSEGMKQVVGLLRIAHCSYSNQLVHFNGSPSTEPAIAQFAVALHRECNYYCANIVNLKDIVVIGLATRDFSMTDIPGRSATSVAYDVTNGQIDAVYNMDKFFQFHVPKCLPGDTVGCGAEVSESKASQGYIFFTLNGVVVQKIELSFIFDDLYPIVGIRSVSNCSTLFMIWNDAQMPVPNTF